MANQITSQREENYEDPDKFRPERWVTGSAREYNEFSCLPFGYGTRSCLGKNMAETEMMLLTAKVLELLILFLYLIIWFYCFQLVRQFRIDRIRLRGHQEQFHDGERAQ